MPSNKETTDDIDWNNLKTITRFDGFGDNNTGGSTKLLADQFIGTIKATASTPVSLLVESLVQQLCMMLDPDPRSSSQLYNTICEQLHKMNLIDKTYKMGEFEVMRSQYQKALYQLVTVARGQDLPVNLQTVWPLTQPVGYDWSRYYREFDEIDYIAGGGFGKVYKVRHKLDGIIYAVKKVTIKSHKIKRVLSHLSEVKTLAALNHNNIVPYKACWLEPLLTNPSQNTKNPNDVHNQKEEEGEEEEEVEEEEEEAEEEEAEEEEEENSHSECVEASDNNTSEESDDSFIQFERSVSASPAVVRFPQKSNLRFDRSQQPHLKLKWATLYIQMALCQTTLREWLDLRNQADDFQSFLEDFFNGKLFNDQILKRQTYNEGHSNDSIDLSRDVELQHLDVVKIIFSQLLDGLDYIHAQNIVHHDIKPSNLFISAEPGRKLLIQLGDFGLACPLQDDHSKNIVGTPTYAAPEQLEGKCEKKSDVYSLGIVLLEILMKFKTDMERVEAIKSAMHGKLPEGITKNFKALLEKLLLPYKHRPDIKQVIKMYNQLIRDDVPSPAQEELDRLRYRIEIQKSIDKEVNNELESKTEELRSKDEEIAFLLRKMELKERESRSKDEEIERLKKLLSECHKKEINK